MKRIGIVVALAVLSLAPVPGRAQAEKPAPAKPAAAKAEAKAEKPVAALKAETKAEKVAAKPAPTRRGAPRADVDARHCLQLPTNREIHTCAEKYR